MKAAPYFEFTTENVCVYIDENNLNFDADQSFMEYKMIFSSHPQITADSYIMDNKLQFNCWIYQRSRFDIDIQPNVNILFNKKYDSVIADYDAMGNIIRKYVCIAKIQKHGSVDLNYRIFPQTKFFVVRTSPKQQKNYHCYTLYRYFDEQHQLDNNFQISIRSVRNIDNKNKRKILIDVVIKTHVHFYDGFKISDSCSQKGLVIRQETKRYSENYGFAPELVASIFSVIGRSPIIQLKSLIKNRLPIPENGKCVEKNLLYGAYRFVVLRNISAVLKSYAPLKIDILSSKILSTNGLHRTLYNLQQQAYPTDQRNEFLPKQNRNALGMIDVCKVGIIFSDEFGNTLKPNNLLKRSSQMLQQTKIKRNKKQ